jgi:predicted nucleic-acid-binding Zn-ribbon protein
MGRFFDAVRAGVKGFRDANDPTEFSVAGRPVRCPHCGGTRFAQDDALLNTRVRPIFNVDWADPGATILICAECGRVEWFVNEPSST